MIIDIYDPGYMERPREERFGELKSLLSHDIMSVKKVYVQWQRTVIELKLKADWVGIERIVEIHKMLETLYPQITPFSRKNCVLNDGSLELDNSYDNRYIPHYKTVKQKGKSRNRHQEGEQYLYMAPNAACASWYGMLGRGKYLKASTSAISTGTS